MFCSGIPAFPAHQSRYSILSSSANQMGTGGVFKHTQQRINAASATSTPPNKNSAAHPNTKPLAASRQLQQQQQQKQVRISPLVMVRPSLHVREYTSDEIQQTWYTRKEIKDIKSEGKRLAGMDSHTSPPHADVDDIVRICTGSPTSTYKNSMGWAHRKTTATSAHLTTTTSTTAGAAAATTPSEGMTSKCLRGLEGKTTLGLYRKREVKYNAREAVLDEQQKQWQKGIHDVDAIARVYVQVAEAAQITAYILGLRDEREVKSMTDATTTTSSSKSRGGSGGGFGNSLLKVTLQRWQSFEKHAQLL
jgi:hypothetical protein